MQCNTEICIGTILMRMFCFKFQLPHIGAYVFEHPSVSKRSKRSAENHLQLLKSHPKVSHLNYRCVFVLQFNTAAGAADNNTNNVT